MKQKLSRSLTLTQMVLYGLGTTVGAGIYALVGKLAGIAGYLAPFSFLIAALLAGFTAMSFAELSGRFPKAAGAALYIEKGIGQKWLAMISGGLVILAGMVSASALSNAFVGYLGSFIEIEREVAIAAVILFMVLVAVWGISQSVWLAATITVIEVGGLIWLVIVASPAFSRLPEMYHLLLPKAEIHDISLIFFGSVLAFYAFIGFEDMVDVAEEIKDVRKTLPKAILLTLLLTTILYVLVTVASVLAMPLEQLQVSEAPLADIFQRYTGKEPVLIGLIGMLAIVNGALVQIIMASRVFYGLSKRGQLPAIFSQINSFTHTPIIATLFTAICILVMAILGNLGQLAQITSLLMLSVFCLVNLALWRLKPAMQAPKGIITFPRWIPLLGFLTSGIFVLVKLIDTFSIG